MMKEYVSKRRAQVAGVVVVAIAVVGVGAGVSSGSASTNAKSSLPNGVFFGMPTLPAGAPEHPPVPAHTMTAPSPTDPLQSTPSGLARVFPVLDASAEGDQAPAFMAKEASEFNVNPALGRRALVMGSGDTVYLVPGQGAICALDEDLAVNQCTSATVATTIGNVQATTCSPFINPDDVQISAIVPAEASGVRVSFSNGSAEAITPSNGVFVLDTLRTSPLPVSVEWNGTDGAQHSITANMPPDAASEDCHGLPNQTAGQTAAFMKTRVYGGS